jgi:hypothetical protein
LISAGFDDVQTYVFLRGTIAYLVAPAGMVDFSGSETSIVCITALLL